jgi:hypothetical protein
MPRIRCYPGFVSSFMPSLLSVRPILRQRGVVRREPAFFDRSRDEILESVGPMLAVASVAHGMHRRPPRHRLGIAVTPTTRATIGAIPTGGHRLAPAPPCACAPAPDRLVLRRLGFAGDVLPNARYRRWNSVVTTLGNRTMVLHSSSCRACSKEAFPDRLPALPLLRFCSRKGTTSESILGNVTDSAAAATWQRANRG